MDIYVIIGRYWFADSKEDYCVFGATSSKWTVDVLAMGIFRNDKDLDYIGYQHWRNFTELVEEAIIEER